MSLRRLFPILTLVVYAAALFGQTYTATITGVVTDPTLAAVPGAGVAAVNQETNAKTPVTCDQEGRYTIPALNPGIYRLEVSHPGFKGVTRSNITLEIDQVARVDIKLEIGDVNLQIEVTGEAPLINTETSSKGQVIEEKEIHDFPMESRDFFGLAFLVPGVTPGADGAGEGSSYANINGARHNEVNYLVDGANNKNSRFGVQASAQMVDTFREFKVLTANYSAEYGRMSSGVMNAVLKSGTNQFHGMLYEYHRNKALDARNFYDQEKSQLIRNVLGGNVAGPIVRNRLFFFGSYEAERERQGSPRLDRVPTAQLREGDFSGFAYPVVDPLNQARPFPGNVIPKARMDPTSVKVQSYIPSPNLPVPFGTNNFFNNKVATSRIEHPLGKIDWNVRPGTFVAGRYSGGIPRTVNPFQASSLPGFEALTQNRRLNASVNVTHMMTATTFTQLIFGFTRQISVQGPLNDTTNYAEQLGIPGTTRDPDLFGFPQITIRTYATMADRERIRWTGNDYQLSDIFTLIRGAHNIRVGGELMRMQLFELVAAQSRGRFNFNGRWTSTSTDARRQEPYADFLLGYLNSTNRRVNSITDYVFASSASAFFQDDWKVRRDLTLNLGLRYELYGPPYDKRGQWTNFVPQAGAIILAGNPAYPRSLVHTDKNNFGPRVGFAWRPFGQTRTVVRGGYGIFYGWNLLGTLQASLGTNAPFTMLEAYQRDPADALGLTFSNPFPQGRGNVTGINQPKGIDLHAPTPYLQNYNFTIERDLGRGTALEIAYVGSKGTHLGHQWDLNQPLRGPDAPRPFPRPFPAFAAIQFFSFDAISNYNALQASLRARHRRLDMRINYTFSKSIDEGSNLTGASAGGYDGLQDSRNRSLERGLSDFDRRHAFVASAIYSLPASVASGPRWLRPLFAGWQVSSILKMYAGTPVTPQMGSVNLDLGEARRPDRLGQGTLPDPRPEMWFDMDAFDPVPPGSYRFGNSGRNIFSGPGRLYLDGSLLKNFKLRERDRLQFRWELFNVLNHVNFRTPNPNVDAPNGGVITGALAARQMQVALKYIF